MRSAVSPPAPPPTSGKERAILDAAEREFLAYGFKKTSMEGIARTADVAKATLYAHFPTKQRVFDVVCARRSTELAERARAAARAAPSPKDAVVASLVTKFVGIQAFVRHSVHAPELLSAALSPENPDTARTHEDYIDENAALVARALPLSKREARALAEVLELAAEGVLKGSTDERTLRARLTMLLARVLG